MELNNLVKEHLLPLLQAFNFELVEDTPNLMRLTSIDIEILICYDPRDRSKSISFSKYKGSSTELNDSAIKELFNSDLKINAVSTRMFVENITHLLQQKEGIEMLHGNIIPLENSMYRQSKECTLATIHQQTLRSVDKAWDDKDYAAFIELIGKIDPDSVPASYILKYKLALKSLNS